MVRGRILIVDSSQVLLELFQMVLEEEGYEVYLFNKVIEGMGEVEQLHPDLIIVDCMLPVSHRLPGIQMLQQVLTHPATASIPFLVCTARISVLRDFEGYFRERGILVMPKPFDVESLLDIIWQIILLHRKSDA